MKEELTVPLEHMEDERDFFCVDDTDILGVCETEYAVDRVLLTLLVVDGDAETECDEVTDEDVVATGVNVTVTDEVETLVVLPQLE